MFNTDTLIEAFGYLGSLLVLVSMLMTSVVKLRIINTIGSVIFTIYAFIIKSYPTALMNFCLVLINLNFLWRMSRMGKEYEVVECESNDKLLRHLLDHYREDISKSFPGLEYDPEKLDKNYVVLCEGKPVGFSCGSMNNDELELVLDYSIPEYRDFSIGTFLLDHFAKNGIRAVVYKGPDENHQAYLKRMNYVKEGDVYIRRF